MKKVFLLLGFCLMLSACGKPTPGIAKFNAVSSTSTEFLDACAYSSIDYQITGDNSKKTLTISCSVKSDYLPSSN
jgi:starvation-inducible outer membrane lipoprotein